MKSCDAIVAGGAGFLGSALCRRLVNTGLNVICVDNFSTGSVKNVSDILRSEKFNIERCNISEMPEIKSPVLFNLATPAGPQIYQAKPATVIEDLFLGNFRVLHWATAQKSVVITASSSEVYGDPLVEPQSEKYNGNVDPVGPRSAYSEGKRAEEAICAAFARQHGVDVRIARIFNTYGPGMDLTDGRMVSEFVVRALRGEPITLYGDGSQTRSLTYVEDIVDGLMLMMQQPFAAWDPINLGVPTNVTVRHVAETVIRKTGSLSVVECGPSRPEDPVGRRPAIDRATELLGWHPKIVLEDGLDRTIEDIRRRMRACGA